jgi:hypothetical protein
LEIRRTADIDLAFEPLKGGGVDALYVAPDPFVIGNQARINTSALGARLPRWMSYGANFPDLFRHAAE